MGTIDLDAARAARGELQERTVVLQGETFHLPAEMPYDVGDAWNRNDSREGISILLGAEQAVRFWDLHPSIQDVTELVRSLVREYGFDDEGESTASNGSSPSTSSRSRPTSRASTG